MAPFNSLYEILRVKEKLDEIIEGLAFNSLYEIQLMQHSHG